MTFHADKSILCKFDIVKTITLKPLIYMGFFAVYIVYILNTPNASAEIDLSIISKIESSNRPSVIGDDGKSYGLFQIHPPVVKEFNHFKKENLKHSDMLNPVLARRVASWYFFERIPAIQKWLGIPTNNTTLLGCWNAGCGNVKKGYLPKEYLKKYQQLGGKL